MPLHAQLVPQPKMALRIERAFRQLHQLLCLVQRGATVSDIERAERSYRRSLQKLDVTEHELVRHYPRYRFALLAREAVARARVLTGVAIPSEELN